MDAAAPEAVEPPATSEAASEPRKRSWWRVKIPTGVIATLAGVALTAWLLPAFTRQWDDRQKAHELKATLATEVAVATAKSITRSREELAIVLAKPNGGEGMFEGAYTRLAASWLADSIEIEAKLRAYFESPELFAQLHAYNATMQTLFLLATDPWTMWDYSHGEDSNEFASKNARQLGITTRELRDDLQYLTGNTSYTFSAPGGANDYIFTKIANGVLAKEQALARSISAAHADGYSTTTRDLLHDLLPF
jgi:hypothetical protein